jgi:hypothetical protein
MPANEPIEARFRRKFLMGSKSECWIWQAGIFKGRCDYGAFWWPPSNELAHRAAYRIYVGPIPKNMFVCHACDNKLCVNPSHLFLGTPWDNSRDRDAKGRQARGGIFGRSKIDPAAVREILASELPDTALARQFGVTKGAINHIRHRRNWRHVEA